MTLLRKKVDAWKKESGQHGPLAWNRFAMLELVKVLSLSSSDFIFKGGHLLWVKIKIARSTTDLDFAIRNKHPESHVRDELTKAASLSLLIDFQFEKIELIEKGERVAFKVVVKFSDKEDSSVSNHFSIDIVEDPNIDISNIKIGDVDVMAASNENILLDKLSACHDRGTGNTRMKDYDDLFRFLLSNEEFNKDLLSMLAIRRAIPLELPGRFASESIEETWTNYRRNFMKKGQDDLPETLAQVLKIVNKRVVLILR